MSDDWETQVLDFWFGELRDDGTVPEATSRRWFQKDAEFDETIRRRFGALHAELSAALFRRQRPPWVTGARGRLAAIIVLDQFSRNMYRDTPAMFSQDPIARELSYEMLALDLCAQLPEVMRGFSYLPLMHSEQVDDQRRCCELYVDRPEEEYAVRHREIVERFGRFPHRNSILGRESSEEELEFLEKPGSSF